MKSKTPSVNKITPPRISGILPRERLYVAMDRNFERPAVWVNGEGGAGKSTLVAGYLDSRKIPCLWYQVDKGDADIATLFSYMAIAAEHAAPDENASLPFFTPEYQAGRHSVLRRKKQKSLSSCVERTNTRAKLLRIYSTGHRAGPLVLF